MFDVHCVCIFLQSLSGSDWLLEESFHWWSVSHTVVLKECLNNTLLRTRNYTDFCVTTMLYKSWNIYSNKNTLGKNRIKCARLSSYLWLAMKQARKRSLLATLTFFCGHFYVWTPHFRIHKAKKQK